MTLEPAAVAPVPASKLWTGRVLSALPALAMAFSGVMKLSHAQTFLEKWIGHFGFAESTATGIGLVELGCVAIYLFPRTRVLGAILMTGYLGGAIVTHVRVGDVFVLPLLLGVFVWGGLFLRDRRLTELLPLTKG